MATPITPTVTDQHWLEIGPWVESPPPAITPTVTTQHWLEIGEPPPPPRRGGWQLGVSLGGSGGWSVS